MSYRLGNSRNNLLILIIIIAIFLLTAIFAIPVDANGTANATLSIPSINVNAPIVTIGIRAFPNGDVTWDTTQITSEVGFLDGLSWFGQGGNTVLGGHSELTGRTPAVFYELDRVSVGDEIMVTIDGSEFHYQVTQTFTVNDRDLSILYPTTNEQLTLFTCDRASFDGAGYGRRDVVIATPIN